MDKLYNVYFAGQPRAGHDLAAVRERVGRLFNADQATLDKLFSGRQQLIKRNCDRATASKYKQALEQAGAIAIVKPAAAAADQVAPPARQPSAAERIAALAAAPDIGAGARSAGGADEPPQPGTIGLSPEGTDVLRENERAAPVASSVNAPELDVAPGGERLSAEPPPPPPAPDTSHLSAAAPGEVLPTLPSDSQPLDPDTSALHLAPAGTDFSDCAAPDALPPELDLSDIDLAPPGSEVLEPQYRQRSEPPPPPTDHLSLDE